MRLLEPGGVAVVAIPNPDSLQARAFGDRWLHLDLPLHLVHIPAPALLARLRELGMRIERVSYLRGGQVVFGWLHGIVGLLPGHPDLYDAIRRPEARRRPLSPGAAPRRRSPPGRSRSSRPRPARSPRPPLRRGGTRVRGGAPWLSSGRRRSS